MDIDVKQNKVIERLRKKLAEILYNDLVKRSKTELGNQELPAKSRIIQMIYTYINQFTKETLNDMVLSFSKRKSVVDELIDSLIIYF